MKLETCTNKRTLEQFKDAITTLTAQYINGELREEYFMTALFEYGEISPCASIVAGATLLHHSKEKFNDFLKKLWQYSNS